jgi:hypothetical protein
VGSASTISKARLMVVRTMSKDLDSFIVRFSVERRTTGVVCGKERCKKSKDGKDVEPRGRENEIGYSRKAASSALSCVAAPLLRRRF